MAEVGKAAARQRMNLDEANDLTLRLLERYEPVFERSGGNPGQRFDQVYNLSTLQPNPDWARLYDEVKSELGQMGLRFN
jgi:methylamine--corrinoid protein Co-methyltransferase